MRNILDHIFSNRRAAIIAPLITAVVMYLLFVLFGQGEDKQALVLAIPVYSALCYGATFVVFWLQVKNPVCPDWFLDFVELMCLAVFGVGAVVFILRFFVNMDTGFAPTLCPCILTWSAVALVEGKRSL